MTTFPNGEQPSLLTLSDVARLGAVSQATVRRWINSGVLTPVQMPFRDLRFRPTDVYSLLGLDKAGDH